MKNVRAVVMDKTGTITKGEFKVQSVIPFGNTSMDKILLLAAECEMNSTHPIGSSIVRAAKERELSLVRPEEVTEISGKGIRAKVPEGEVLCGNRSLMEAYKVETYDYHNQKYGTEVLVAWNGKLIGCLIISDTIKNDAASSIKTMKGQNLVTAMLTGDAKESAEAVAAEVGIDEVHAELLPQDKLEELQKIRRTHGAVLFVVWQFEQKF